MSGQTTRRTAIDEDTAETWPWACLGCDSSVYHDVEFCRDCVASFRSRPSSREPNTSDHFVDWMRDQPAPTFVMKVTAMSGIELVLTAFWLQTVFQWPLEWTRTMPLVF